MTTTPTRRAILAGAPAAMLAAAFVPPAAANVPEGDDRELFRIVARFHKAKAAVDAREAEEARLEQGMPEHLRGNKYCQIRFVKDGQTHVGFEHDVCRMYKKSSDDWPSQWPADHPAQKLFAQIERQRQEHREWEKRLGIDKLPDTTPLYNAKSDAETDVLMTPAKTPEGFRAKLEVYQHWYSYMEELYEPALPVLLDECERLIGRAAA